MNKIFGTCALLAFLAVPAFAFAQNPPTITSWSPEVSISVHDYADVPTPLLAAAEDQASSIFRQAGLETVWLNCGPKVERTEPKTCYATDATHLMLKILPHAISARASDRNDVLGTALLDEQGTGYYAYAFYDRVRKLADDRSLGYALLGDVFAHEIGHLLLGSNAHSISGIMCPHWRDKELLSISEGAMTFAPSQSRIMKDRLRVRQSERIDLTALVTDPSSQKLAIAAVSVGHVSNIGSSRAISNACLKFGPRLQSLRLPPLALVFRCISMSAPMPALST
jgi:hypothetical protein